MHFSLKSHLVSGFWQVLWKTLMLRSQNINLNPAAMCFGQKRRERGRSRVSLTCCVWVIQLHPFIQPFSHVVQVHNQEGKLFQNANRVSDKGDCCGESLYEKHYLCKNTVSMVFQDSPSSLSLWKIQNTQNQYIFVRKTACSVRPLGFKSRVASMPRLDGPKRRHKLRNKQERETTHVGIVHQLDTGLLRESVALELRWL